MVPRARTRARVAPVEDGRHFGASHAVPTSRGSPPGAPTATRRSWCAFDNDEQQGRLAMTAALRDAIEPGEIHVADQPIVDTYGPGIVGFEALARWRHPQWGQVPPARFIPLAEASGLMERLGEHVMRTACAGLKDWHAQGFTGLTMPVNVSPSRFGQGTLARLVEACLRDNGLQPADLTLEVTEEC